VSEAGWLLPLFAGLLHLEVARRVRHGHPGFALWWAGVGAFHLLGVATGPLATAASLLLLGAAAAGLTAYVLHLHWGGRRASWAGAALVASAMTALVASLSWLPAPAWTQVALLVLAAAPTLTAIAGYAILAREAPTRAHRWRIRLVACALLAWPLALVAPFAALACGLLGLAAYAPPAWLRPWIGAQDFMTQRT